MDRNIKGHDQLEYIDEFSHNFFNLVIYKYKPKLYTEFVKSYPDIKKMKEELSKYMDGIFIEKYTPKNSKDSYSTMIFVKDAEFYEAKGWKPKEILDKD